jgi:hypothetical protein
MVVEFYQNQKLETQERIKFFVNKVRKISFLRLLIFLAIVSSGYLFWNNNVFFSISIFLGITLFIVVLNFWLDAKLNLEKFKQKLSLINFELKSLEGELGVFDSAPEFQENSHAFSNDLDLFSPKGLFSFINRTSSFLGKKTLATSLLEGREDYLKSNKKIEFLANHIAWTLDFRTSGTIKSREKSYDKQLANFSKLDFSNSKTIHFLAYLIPVVAFSALILFNFNLISAAIAIPAFLLCLLPASIILKKTNAIMNTLSEYEPKINTFMEQLILLEKLRGKDKENVLEFEEMKRLEEEFKSWKKIAKRFDLRLNLVFSLPINIFLAWDIWQRIALEKWVAKNGKELLYWENKLIEIEFLISGATIRFNNRESTVFADIVEEGVLYNAKEIAHPLIHKTKRKTNDFHLKESESFYILTGPNMAGKSTFLRSLGINLVLANAGFPVFAETFTIPEVKLFSSMRTSDDLANESSYFHAELSRLALMKETLEKNKKLFVLLDEILKGTNSVDKQEGSKKFLSKMQKLGARGVIATHDLSLCELSKENSAFVNYYFDSNINGDEMTFDYKINRGICQNMNASFLLKKMNLID